MSSPAVVSENFQFLFRQAPLPNNQLRVSVIIPVHNEALYLENTLLALVNQADAAGKPLNKQLYEVLVLANNCTDESAAIAQNCRSRFPSFNLYVEDITLSSDNTTIGRVRRMLMDTACQRLSLSACHRGIIASTDGDTMVHPEWVYHIIKEIDKGNDAVGGRILTDKMDYTVRLPYLRDVMYRTLLAKAEAVLDPSVHDKWPKHFQYFGASLAVTSSAYIQAGRLPALPFLEDVAFYKSLQLIDAKVRKSNAVRAYTSSRFQGKVSIGFSEQLKKWSEMTQQNGIQMVEPVKAALSRLRNRFALRRFREAFLKNDFKEKDLQLLALKLSVPGDWLYNALESNLYFGQLWHEVEVKKPVSDSSSGQELIPVTQAINELRLFLHQNYPD